MTRYNRKSTSYASQVLHWVHRPVIPIIMKGSETTSLTFWASVSSDYRNDLLEKRIYAILYWIMNSLCGKQATLNIFIKNGFNTKNWRSNETVGWAGAVKIRETTTDLPEIMKCRNSWQPQIRLSVWNKWMNILTPGIYQQNLLSAIFQSPHTSTVKPEQLSISPILWKL